MTGLSLVVLAALQVWDIWLTTRILRAGGREMNGIVRALMEVAGNGWGAVKYAGGMGAGIALASAGHAWPIWIIIGIMALVVDHNLGEWRKIRRGDR